MMKKLFYQDTFLDRCNAKIVSINGNDVVLDQTVFFAFAGGQASDKGTINGITVTNAVDKEDHIVYTLEDASPLSVGDEVEVVIDLERRKKLARLHTAVHFVDYLFQKKVGELEVVGSNIDENKGRMDYVYNESVSPLLASLEKECNELFSQNLPIKLYNDPENPKRRIWESAGYKCECCGTHLTNTSFIGTIGLKRKNIGKGKERIEVSLKG